MDIVLGVLLGVAIWFFARYGLGGFYTIGPNERAVLCTFGRAQRLQDETTLSDPVAEKLNDDEKQRYEYPQVRVVAPGFHWKLPWQTLHRASMATSTVSIAFDPEDPSANSGGQVLEAVTKDQLNTGLSGQIRFTVAERNLYAYLFGVKRPVAHVLGYFVSILRDRIANFEAPGKQAAGTDAAADALDIGGVQGISINDLRKNLRDLNERMDAGDMILKREVPIAEDDTGGTLHDKLAGLGARLIVEALESLPIRPSPQSEIGVTYAVKIDKAEARVDFSRTAQELHNLIRGLSPFPGAFFEMDFGKGLERVKILRTTLAEGAGKPGEILDETPRNRQLGDGRIGCSDGLLDPPVPQAVDQPVVIQLAGAWNSFDTQARLDVTRNGLASIGTTLDMEQFFGVPVTQWDFRADGSWRISKRNYIDFGYASLNRSGTRAIDVDVVWNGYTYKAGATIDGKFDNTYAYVGWHYDIFRADVAPGFLQRRRGGKMPAARGHCCNKYSHSLTRIRPNRNLARNTAPLRSLKAATHPGMEKPYENTKRIRREYEGNTKGIRSKYEDLPPASAQQLA